MEMDSINPVIDGDGIDALNTTVYGYESGDTEESEESDESYEVGMTVYGEGEEVVNIGAVIGQMDLTELYILETKVKAELRKKKEDQRHKKLLEQWAEKQRERGETLDTINEFTLRF